ncbi:hypothetical protein FIBSPDRAFT_995192 [Athelia psychrophila]|uniref:BTB domain-containing protein n=1 Tax=Athelia psychrophila TaxID=1759441 RepID=A0A166RLK0_9AGAM|nr:hypothetical protein FIBSPDRAFT_995192 [Fibularhizoctonia sp. CBS 109695]
MHGVLQGKGLLNAGQCLGRGPGGGCYNASFAMAVSTIPSPIYVTGHSIMLTVRPTKPSLRINPNGKPIPDPLEATSSTPLKDLILTPHPNHYIKDGDVTFVVEKTLYRVHACFFARHSPVFAEVLKSEDSTAISQDSYIQLAGVSIEEFEEFLSVIYPTDLGVTPDRKENEWRNLLSFASAFSFKSLTITALAGLDKHLQPVEKILLGDQLSIPELTHQGVRALCTRKPFLSPDEGRALGLESVLCVARLREETLCYQPDKAGKLTEKLINESLAQRLVEPPVAATVPNGAGAVSNQPATSATSTSTATAGMNSSPSATGAQNKHKTTPTPAGAKRNGDPSKSQTDAGAGGKGKEQDGSKGTNGIGL